MKDIRFYDFDFNLVYIVSDWISLNWELKYNDVGTFELKLPPLSSAKVLTDRERQLIAVQGDRQAVITGMMLSEDITLYGRTPNWLLGKRLVMPFEMGMQRDIEDIIRMKMSEAFDSDDKLFLADAIGGFELLEELKVNRPKDMLTFISENLEKESAGHRLIFEPLNHRWLFEIYRGEEKSIILSEANKNAYSPEYTFDILDLADGLCYKNGDSGEYITLPCTKKGILRWYCIGKAENREDALLELEKLKENSSLSFETADLKYGTDYGLGDVFYVETDFCENKIRKESRVTGVRIWDEALNKGESPEFEEKEADGNGD